MATRAADESPATAAGGRPRPRVLVHIGEPKTGTTFLQQVMWSNRAELAAQGVVLPGHHPQDHFRASQDLRGIEKRADDPAGSWAGEWEILAHQARQAPRAAVISHELFSAVDDQQAAEAVRSLQPAEVHIVLTVRDMASLLPAEWQETIKHRNDRGWEDWLADVIDRESADPDRRQWWFWRVHDTLAILDLWARHVPADRIHVIMTPPQGSGNSLLWERFAALLDVDPGGVDLSRARANTSLGLPEIEFLRRLNQALPAEVPDWFYMWTVKEGVAHRALAARPRHGRLVLPADREAWAKEQAEILISGLASAGYDVIGDLEELRPRPPREPRPGSARPGGGPGPGRRGRRGRGTGGQPVPQGVPRRGPAAGTGGPRRPGQPGRGGRRGLAPAQAGGAGPERPLPGGAAAAHPDLAGHGTDPGPEALLGWPPPARPPRRAGRPG